MPAIPRCILTTLIALLPACHSPAQSGPTQTPAPNDARKLLDLEQAASQSRAWASAAREKVWANQSLLPWLKTVATNYQAATKSMSEGQQLEVVQWVDEWREHKDVWSWIAPTTIEPAATALSKLRESAKARGRSETESMSEVWLSLARVANDLLEEQRKSHANGYRDEIATSAEALESAKAWALAAIECLQQTDILAKHSENRSKNAKQLEEATAALKAAKSELPKLKKRAKETENWASEADAAIQKNTDRDAVWELQRKLEVAEEAHKMATRDVTKCEQSHEDLAARIAECSAVEKEAEAEAPRLAASVASCQEKHATAHKAAADAWAQLAAAVTERASAIGNETKQLEEDAALWDRAADRWLEEAKELARGKGR